MNSWEDAVTFLADCEYIGKDTKTKRARFNEADLAALEEDSGEAQEKKQHGKGKEERREVQVSQDVR